MMKFKVKGNLQTDQHKGGLNRDRVETSYLLAFLTSRTVKTGLLSFQEERI